MGLLANTKTTDEALIFDLSLAQFFFVYHAFVFSIRLVQLSACTVIYLPHPPASMSGLYVCILKLQFALII